MRVINNQTKEDMKYTPAFDPDKLPVCPNCEADMLEIKLRKTLCIWNVRAVREDKSRENSIGKKTNHRRILSRLYR